MKINIGFSPASSGDHFERMDGQCGNGHHPSFPPSVEADKAVSWHAGEHQCALSILSSCLLSAFLSRLEEGTACYTFLHILQKITIIGLVTAEHNRHQEQFSVKIIWNPSITSIFLAAYDNCKTMEWSLWLHVGMGNWFLLLGFCLFVLKISSLVASMLKFPKVNPGHLQLLDKGRIVFLGGVSCIVMRGRNQTICYYLVYRSQLRLKISKGSRKR